MIKQLAFLFVFVLFLIVMALTWIFGGLVLFWAVEITLLGILVWTLLSSRRQES